MSLAQKPNGLGWAVVAVWLSMTGIVTVTCALRVYVRARIVKRRGTWEDYFSAVGWLLFVVCAALASAATFYGLGRPVFPRPPPGLWVALELNYFHHLGFALANMAIKQSIALMLLRYAVEDYHKKLIYLVTFFLQFCSMNIFFSVLYYCQPVSFFWTQARGVFDGRCMDRSVTVKMTYGYAAALVLFDFTMAILPWFMVRKLQLDLRTRLMVTTILAFGSIAFIVTIIRIPYTIKIAHAQDVFQDTATIIIVSSLEAGLSFAASCAATLKPLFRGNSSQTPNRAPGRTPQLATIPVTADGSCSTGTTKQADIEFATAFRGTDCPKSE